MHCIGVVGGGRMGSGVAHGFLTAGNAVVLIEANDVLAAGAKSRVEQLVRTGIERGVLDRSFEEVMQHFTSSTNYADLNSCAMVIEAVPEIPELKDEVLQRIEAAVDVEAVIATNTSSISIDTLAAGLTHQTRFLGMHFFNPVPASKLVEIVRGSATSESTLQQALAAVAQISKTPIVVGDSPGFATSRLGLALGLEAIRMVEEGVASPADIDNGMVLGYKHPVGPLKLTDMVGLDVRLGIARYLHATLGDRFEPPQLLIDMVDRGELGMKTGRGFYDWPDSV